MQQFKPPKRFIEDREAIGAGEGNARIRKLTGLVQK